jgi:RNA polymerase sigma factor (sigma-70 family)
MEGWAHRTDEELLEATPRDGEAFGELYRRHEDAVLVFFLRRVRDAELAADLTAETFARALAAVTRFRRDERAPARAWLFGIARNTLAASRRRGQVESRARRRLGLPALELTDDDLERIWAVEAEAAPLLEALPSTQRHALRARVLEERTYADIARELQTSEAVIRQRVSRGLSHLRRQLGRAW